MTTGTGTRRALSALACLALAVFMFSALLTFTRHPAAEAAPPALRVDLTQDSASSRIDTKLTLIAHVRLPNGALAPRTWSASTSRSGSARSSWVARRPRPTAASHCPRSCRTCRSADTS